MKHLRYCLMDASFEAKENRHPEIVMKELGIKYQLSVPQSIYDQWWFFCCENIPKDIPSFLTSMKEDNDFRNMVGVGLSLEDCKKLENYISSNYKDN